MRSDSYDIAIIGGGIVGLATALGLLEKKLKKKLVVLEKEPEMARHQTGHNSGVIHSGLYYRPGSLKASLCVRGAQALVQFCRQHHIPTQGCGKVVVATRPEELSILERLYQRGLANSVPNLALIGPEQLRQIEPHAHGLRAIHVPSTAIVDFVQVARTMAKLIGLQGGEIRLSCQVRRITHTAQKKFLMETTQGPLESRLLINCAGLYVDRLARGGAQPPDCRIVPFRGEYMELVEARRHLVRGLIYPVPDPNLPFLGVHLTRTVDGRVEAGPSAVLALKREGYRRTDFDWRDALEIFTYPGFWRMAARYGLRGFQEFLRAMDKRRFVSQAKRLVPALEEKDFIPAGSGVRAQALDLSGNLLDDFRILQRPGAIHLLNVPSPAATSSLSIGEWVADLALEQLTES